MDDANFQRESDGIIAAYDKLVLGIDQRALGNKEGRAYGGIIRAGKGNLVESIAEELTWLAWRQLGKTDNKLDVGRKRFKILIRRDYLEKIKIPDVKEYIQRNIDKYEYVLAPDRMVFVDNNPTIAIECKAYTENAMMKRILVDFSLLKQSNPNISCVLLQLESQLGGDYSDLKGVHFGSKSTHTLMSYFNVDLNIITLLEGERHVDKPIHKKEYFKPLTKKGLENAVKAFQSILMNY